MSVIKYSKSRNGNESLSAHFKVKEFACKDGSDSILINNELILVLESLYMYLNNKYGIKAINITSGYRTPSHSVKVGGYATDQHTKGNAADIQVKVSALKKLSAKEICLALEDLNHQGGIGYINSNSVHVDVRGKKTWFDETKGEKTTSSWYSYFGVNKPGSTTSTTSTTKYIQLTSGVWCRKGIGFKYAKYKCIPKNTKCELLKKNAGSSNGYKWDKVKYNRVTVYLPNNWNKYL